MATSLGTSHTSLAPAAPSSRLFSLTSSSPCRLGRRPCLPLRCSSRPVDAAAAPGEGAEYRPSFADDLLLAFFRSKMVEEVGWDSEKPGYAGLMEVVNRLMIKGKSASEIEQSAVRVLQSLFSPLLLVLFKALLAPIANGQLASMMLGKYVSGQKHIISLYSFAFILMRSVGFFLLCVYGEARATALSCQWLMGPCSVNSVTLPDGKSWSSGVFVEKCKYLEESKCLGICINTCKLPTQTFFKDHMGVDLYMEPNFEDYSCQFNFGAQPPPLDSDKALKEPCLDICTSARRRRELGRNGIPDELSCPQV